jgi:hypothetical protein
MEIRWDVGNLDALARIRPVLHDAWGQVELRLRVPSPQRMRADLLDAGASWADLVDGPDGVEVFAGGPLPLIDIARGVDSHVRGLSVILSSDMDTGETGVLDDILPILGQDALSADWECWFPGAVGGYNGVMLLANQTFGGQVHPGGVDVIVSINYKSIKFGMPDDIARRIGTENDVLLHYSYTE